MEQKNGTSIYRVTDHKTGKNRTTWKTVIGGGAILQPVLYSLAVEQALDAQVTSGRLFYCTAPGGFTDHEIPINEANRRAGLEALEIVDRAIELGFLPAAPSERACGWCDFRPVCGPHEQQRVAVKPAEKLGDLGSPAEDAVQPCEKSTRPETARDVIADALDDTVVVEAAAGTGKTTELVNRILRVIATGRAEVRDDRRRHLHREGRRRAEAASA